MASMLRYGLARVVRRAPIKRRAMCTKPTKPHEDVFQKPHSPKLLARLAANNMFPWITLATAVVFAGASTMYFESELKHQTLEHQLAQQRNTQGIGTPAIGGPFSLVDPEGNRVTKDTYNGKFQLLYFGFTYCPDICPEELQKMTEIVTAVDKTFPNAELQPIFISIDPERDSPEVVGEYVKEFHPRLIGLTGTAEEVKAAAKNFRIYYSKSPAPDGCDPNDYLVDHIIICILLDPQGNFLNYYGQNVSAKQAARSIVDQMQRWKPAPPTAQESDGSNQDNTS